jgi:hypothetical protein
MNQFFLDSNFKFIVSGKGVVGFYLNSRCRVHHGFSSSCSLDAVKALWKKSLQGKPSHNSRSPLFWVTISEILI